MKRLPAAFRKPLFWIIPVVFLTVATILTVLFLFAGIVTNVIFEGIIIIAAGIGFYQWFNERQRDVLRQQESRLKLEAVQRELQEHIKTVRENEKRLAVLHSVTAAINQFSSLDSILNTAADKVMEAVNIDGVLIYLIDEEKEELELKQYRGISASFAQQVSRLKVEDGFDNFPLPSVDLHNVTNTPVDPLLSNEAVNNRIAFGKFLVPLTAQDKVLGTVCALFHSTRQLNKDEEQLLVLIGVELGLAVERAALSDEKERAGRRFKELFEKAHDAIWVQDLDGKILDANQAMADFTGYRRERLIGGDVIRSLSPKALELARDVRRKLLAGIPVEQPYEQRITRRDGTEAVIMLTTSLVKEEGKPVVFQHISRDVTREKKLAENLRLYAQQITRTQEDERKRIARELHDDSIQALIILTRNIDELISMQAKRSKMIRPLEDIRTEVDKIISQVRRFTQDLRPPTLDYLGLIPAVRELISQFEHQSNIKAELKISGDETQFAPEAEMLVYRIIQEALNNIWRHSAAPTALVSLNFGKDSAMIEIKDDGKGFVIGEDLRFVEAGKIGLAGMQERADLLGGNLSIQSNVGHGTLVKLLVPYERWKKESLVS
jgi:two-component system, NarL family, sensor histidine kinase DegS